MDKKKEDADITTVDLKKGHKKIKDYLLTKILGEGNFGKVYEAIHAQTK